MLITGGVLAIVTSSINLLLFGGLFAAAAADPDGVPDLGPIDDHFAPILALVASLALIGLVLGSIACASKPWAAWASAVVQALFLVLFGLFIVAGDAPGFIFLALPCLLSVVFSILGVKQAKAYLAWRATNPGFL